MWKIVDTFCGYEDNRRFETIQQAEKQLAKDRKEFYKYNTRNTHFCRSVIPANYTWQFDQYYSSWSWEK